MNKLLALVAATSLTASPAWGTVREAAYASSADNAQVRTGMFTGATYSIGFDRAGNSPRGRASFKLSGMTSRPGTSELRFGQGIEISTSRSGKPALLVGGADVGELRESAKLNGTATAAVVVVGVILVAGAIFLATNCDNDCDNARNE